MKLLVASLLATGVSIAALSAAGHTETVDDFTSAPAIDDAISISYTPSVLPVPNAFIAAATVDPELTAPAASPDSRSFDGSQEEPTVTITTPTPTPSAAKTSTPTPTPSATSTPSPTPATSSPTGSGSGSHAGSSASAGKGTNPLVIKGFRFFDSVTGDYFPMRGVNYYPRPNTGPLDANNLDLFTEEYRHVWERDVPEFVALSANAIRLYAVDPAVDHSAFMCALQAEGIYVMVDLGSSCEGCEITADAAPDCYPASYKARGEKIIQQFAQFDNVIGFSGGNEINHRTGGNPWTWNAACQKKFIRDMRAYIQSCAGMRQIPVGVVMADTDRDENALYYNCRTDEADELESVEWYGINVYVHCDDIDDSAKAAGFNLLRDSFESYKYSVPALLTEYGCLAPSFPTVDGFQAQRTFHDAKWMNDRDYSDYFGGGFAFEYSTEMANSETTSPYPFTTFGAQNYGLGYLTPEDCDEVPGSGNNCTFKRFPNFDFLAKAYASYESKDEPTLATFEVPKDRSQPSECPKGSPVLSSYTWAGDSQKTESCPVQGRFQCPAVPTNAYSSSGSGSSASSSNNRKNTTQGKQEDAEVLVGDDDGTGKYESAGTVDLSSIAGSEGASSSGPSAKPKHKSSATTAKISIVGLLPVVTLVLAFSR